MYTCAEALVMLLVLLLLLLLLLVWCTRHNAKLWCRCPAVLLTAMPLHMQHSFCSFCVHTFKKCDTNTYRLHHRSGVRRIRQISVGGGGELHPLRSERPIGSW
jgi:hypothetical protein